MFVIKQHLEDPLVDTPRDDNVGQGVQEAVGGGVPAFIRHRTKSRGGIL
jgi:hypothetical protein